MSSHTFIRLDAGHVVVPGAIFEQMNRLFVLYQEGLLVERSSRVAPAAAHDAPTVDRDPTLDPDFNPQTGQKEEPPDEDPPLPKAPVSLAEYRAPTEEDFARLTGGAPAAPADTM